MLSLLLFSVFWWVQDVICNFFSSHHQNPNLIILKFPTNWGTLLRNILFPTLLAPMMCACDIGLANQTHSNKTLNQELMQWSKDREATVVSQRTGWEHYQWKYPVSDAVCCWWASCSSTIQQQWHHYVYKMDLFCIWSWLLSLFIFQIVT